MENPLIETRDLTRRFGTQLAVDSVNLSVPAAGGLIATLAGCIEFVRRDVI